MLASDRVKVLSPRTRLLRSFSVASWAARSGLVVAAIVWVTSCGIDRGDPTWIGHDAAVIRCTVVGVQRVPAHLLEEIPSPAVPSGLLSRGMDPVALQHLGFRRDSVACATLEAPAEGNIVAAAASLERLIQVRAEVDAAVWAQVRCACESAGKLRRRGWLPSCIDRRRSPACEPRDADVQQLRRLIAPLELALGDARLPSIHWRVSGHTDRAGQFEARVPRIVGHHKGGSLVFFKARPVPERLNHVLLRRLLEQDDVVAVMRQDSGRAMLVVRERGSTLIYDHFAYPKVEPSFHTFLAELDNRAVASRLDALRAPRSPRDLIFDPRDGSTVELDYEGLARVDGSLAVAAVVGERSYRPDRSYVLPPMWLDRVALQVPLGGEQRAIRARAILSEEGLDWVGGLRDEPISPTLEEMGGSAAMPVFRARRSDPAFVLRGSPSERVTFVGIHALFGIVAAVEMEVPSSVRGTARDWSVQLPAGPLPGGFSTRNGLMGLRERLSRAPHVLRVQVGGDARTLDATLTPVGTTSD
ncbi:MAG: hypothetical protein V3V08_12730 [Nannocystaceae bacterium]